MRNHVLILLALSWVSEAKCQETIRLPILREPAHGGFLEEIDCRLKESYGRKYGNNTTTWGHEATHRLNSMSCDGVPDMHGFYVLGGDSHLFSNPVGVRMGHVRAEIPANKRCDIYKLYLATHANNEQFPLLLFDEQSAYINACYVAAEYKDDFQLEYELKNADKLSYFCERLLVVLKRVGYRDYDRLNAFHAMQVERLKRLR